MFRRFGKTHARDLGGIRGDKIDDAGGGRSLLLAEYNVSLSAEEQQRHRSFCWVSCSLLPVSPVEN